MNLYKLFLVLCIGLVLSLVAQEQNENTLLMQVKNLDSKSDTLEINGILFSIQPLSIDSSDSKDCDSQWILATPQVKSEQSAWDLAYSIVASDENVLYAEPDNANIDASYPETSEVKGIFNEDWPYPNPAVFAWHKGDAFSQLRSARQSESTGTRVRIAHFDTGYDPNHTTTPKYLRTDLQRNFISGENPYSAVDIGSTGLMNQPGHGTATLAILAGNLVNRPQYNYKDYYGGAPFAEVVPCRISKTVILLKSSSLVSALNYASSINCDVLSMSMGGVASEAWADAVNSAYDKGLVMVTAAGNNIGKKPTVKVVYPARFNRVICVCGITYDNTPYYKYGLFSTVMQGNWGPQSVMGSAIATYTPNVPWAVLNGGDEIRMDGAGTSSATPQVAAAAALWIQKYCDQRYTHPWQKVNAVRHALFSTAKKTYKDSEKYYGNGVLKVKDALAVKPKLDQYPLPKDSVEWPILTLLFGLSGSQAEMFKVELARLEYDNAELQEITTQYEETGKLTKQMKTKLKEIILSSDKASNELKNLFSKL